jgi:hypothetical protein
MDRGPDREAPLPTPKRRGRVLCGHPIAPTEFPRGPSAAGALESLDPHEPRHGTPRRRMRNGQSRPKADTGRGLPPNDSRECWPSASDPQPTTAPAEIQRGVGGGTRALKARALPCSLVGNGPIAIDRPSEPARETGGRFHPLEPLKGGSRCGHGVVLPVRGGQC